LEWESLDKAMMRGRNSELIEELTVYNNLSIVFTKETAADVLGMTSANTCCLYLGPSMYEDGKLVCVGEKLHERDKIAKNCAARVTDCASTICHLIDSHCTDWGLQAIANYAAQAPWSMWHDEIVIRGLMDKFTVCLSDAYELGIITKAQRRNWAGERQYQFSEELKQRLMNRND
jgi:hypothetical protein